WAPSPTRNPTVLSYRKLTSDGQLKGPPPCSGGWSRVVTDGPRVYFSRPSATVAQVSASGGEVNQVQTPFRCFAISDISPDRPELLGFVPADNNALDQPLWALSLATGQAHRVGNIIGRAAGWSADAQKIAYAVGDPNSPAGSAVFTASRDGNEVRKLAAFNNQEVITIRWSPDGTVLRLIVVKDNYCTPWEVSAEGTRL